jgi:ATP-dependent HslUV protease ATP-binding subunit HslU
MERLLDEVSYEATELSDRKVKVDASYVNGQLKDVLASEDLSRYIL